MTEFSARQAPLFEITPERVRAACALVGTGQVISLNLPMDTWRLSDRIARPGLKHTATMHNQTRHRGDGHYVVVNDETVEFATQATSHWDALAHWGGIEPDRPGVYFGGADLDETFPEFGAKTLGIGLLGSAVVTRGVLLDIVGFRRQEDLGFLADGEDVGRAEIESYLAHVGLELQPGDAVIAYTGFQERKAAGHFVLGDPEHLPQAPGLELDTLDLFGPARTFALISDNPSVEPIPMPTGRFHTVALKHYGIHLGELWALSELVMACRAAGRYEFLLGTAPLAIPRAFGSPANAFAVL